MTGERNPETTSDVHDAALPRALEIGRVLAGILGVVGIGLLAGFLARGLVFDGGALVAPAAVSIGGVMMALRGRRDDRDPGRDHDLPPRP